MTEPQAYLLIGTLWMLVSVTAKEPRTGLAAAVACVVFYAAAVWVSV